MYSLWAQGGVIMYDNMLKQMTESDCYKDHIDDVEVMFIAGTPIQWHCRLCNKITMFTQPKMIIDVDELYPITSV
jgi:hypothetical protein